MNRHQPTPELPVGRLPAEAVILCGGEGKRLGRRKETVLHDGRSFLDHHLSRLLPAFERVRVSARHSLEHPPPPEVDLILDPPEARSVIDVIAGILRTVDLPVWIVAVDLPLVPLEIPATLLRSHESSPPGTSVFVEGDRGLEMLVGLYDRAALPAIESLVARGERKLSAITSATSSIVLRFPADFPPLAESSPFFNVNTPEDLTRLEERFSTRDEGSPDEGGGS